MVIYRTPERSLVFYRPRLLLLAIVSTLLAANIAIIVCANVSDGAIALAACLALAAPPAGCLLWYRRSGATLRSSLLIVQTGLLGGKKVLLPLLHAEIVVRQSPVLKLLDWANLDLREGETTVTSVCLGGARYLRWALDERTTLLAHGADPEWLYRAERYVNHER